MKVSFTSLRRKWSAALVGLSAFLLMGSFNLRAQIEADPYEFFFIGVDLQFREITFSPFEDPANPGTILYGVTGKAITALPVTDFGDRFTTSDDDGSRTFQLEEAPFRFYGESFDTVYVNTNGTLNFDEAFSSFSESLTEHLKRKQIAAFWTDLDNRRSGESYYRVTEDAYVFTWDNVGEFANPGVSVTFQVQLKFDGRIIVSFTNITIDNALVGLSSGNNNPGDLVDFSAAPVNITPVDIIFSGSDVDENLNAGTLVANMVALDSDYGDTHSYALVQGAGDTHNRYFYIQGGNQLVTTLPIDFEKDPVLFLRLRVRDTFGNILTTNKTINVNDELVENSDGDALLDIEEVFLGTNIHDASDSKPMYDFVSVASASDSISPSSEGSSESSSPSALVVQYQRSSSQTRVFAMGMWSQDLVNWFTSGSTDATGLTVTINEYLIGSGDPETVQVELDIVNGSTDSLFFKQFLFDTHNP